MLKIKGGLEMAKKRFAIANSFTCNYGGWNFPKNSWYGHDDSGCWVCVHHERINIESPCLELYRYDEIKKDWYISQEMGKTVDFICVTADKYNLWNTPVIWKHPRQEQLEIIYNEHKRNKELSEMMQHKRKHKKNKLHHTLSYYNKGEISLDIAEQVICHCVGCR